MQNIEKLIEIRLVLMDRHAKMLRRILDQEDENEKAFLFAFWDEILELFSWIKLDLLELLSLYGLSFNVSGENPEPLIEAFTEEEKKVLALCFQDRELDEALDAISNAKHDHPTQWCKETCHYLRAHSAVFQDILRKLQQRLNK